jgi:GNAT superfamily N-acetyltransferase
MSIEIKQTETLSADDWQRLYGWGEDIFGANHFNLTWRPKDLHFLLYNDGELFSHVGVLRHTVFVEDKPVIVGGVGGVATLPDAQKKGYAKMLMRHAAEFFEREWKVDAGLLFCLPLMIAFYESLGWQTVSEPVLIEQPNGAIESPIGIMVLPFNDNVRQNGKVELRSLPW